MVLDNDNKQLCYSLHIHCAVVSVIFYSRVPPLTMISINLPAASHIHVCVSRSHDVYAMMKSPNGTFLRMLSHHPHH